MKVFMQYLLRNYISYNFDIFQSKDAMNPDIY